MTFVRFVVLMVTLGCAIIIGTGVYAARTAHAFADDCHAQGGVVVSNSVVRRVCVDAGAVRH